MIRGIADGVTRRSEEAYRWVASCQEKGFRDAIRERDRPWGDYEESSDDSPKA